MQGDDENGTSEGAGDVEVAHKDEDLGVGITGIRVVFPRKWC